MKNLISIPKNLSELLAEVESYLISKEMIQAYYRPFFYKILDLEEFPNLSATLAEMNLTLKSLNIYTVGNLETASSFHESYIIIPFKNFTDMKFGLHELKNNARANYLENGWPYYWVSHTVTIEETNVLDDTIYIVNKDVFHSCQFQEFSPQSPTEFGSFIIIGVNEDLSSYFSE